MEDIYSQIDLFECPRCGGAGLLEEIGGWAFYVMCMDCGCHTAEIEFSGADERLGAAQIAGRLWNMGKTMSDNPGE